MTIVLFACIHNAGRSQMAAAWFNALVRPGSARAVSAGTDPAQRIHPEVALVMAEAGVPLANEAPKRLTDDLARSASVLVTLGCGEECPVIPGLRRMDWPVEDPKGRPIERVREIRDELRARVEALLLEEGVGSDE